MSSRRLQDALPEFAQELGELLRSSKEPELAEQIPELRIARRCECGDDFCATFYTQPDRFADFPKENHCVDLQPPLGQIVTDVASGRITGVEVLYRDDVRKELRTLFP